MAKVWDCYFISQEVRPEEDGAQGLGKIKKEDGAQGLGKIKKTRMEPRGSVSWQSGERGQKEGSPIKKNRQDQK